MADLTEYEQLMESAHKLRREQEQIKAERREVEREIDKLYEPYFLDHPWVLMGHAVDRKMWGCKACGVLVHDRDLHLNSTHVYLWRTISEKLLYAKRRLEDLKGQLR